jgi:hypothetical protein
VSQFLSRSLPSYHSPFFVRCIADPHYLMLADDCSRLLPLIRSPVGMTEKSGGVNFAR